MDAIRKRLFNQNATPGTHLRRISWISVNQIPANLMSKFISLVSDPLMDPFNYSSYITNSEEPSYHRLYPTVGYIFSGFIMT